MKAVSLSHSPSQLPRQRQPSLALPGSPQGTTPPQRAPSISSPRTTKVCQCAFTTHTFHMSLCRPCGVVIVTFVWPMEGFLPSLALPGSPQGQGTTLLRGRLQSPATSEGLLLCFQAHFSCGLLCICGVLSAKQFVAFGRVAAIFFVCEAPRRGWALRAPSISSPRP